MYVMQRKKEKIMANRDGRKRGGKSILEKRRLKREKQAANTVRIRKRNTTMAMVRPRRLAQA